MQLGFPKKKRKNNKETCSCQKVARVISQGPRTRVLNLNKKDSNRKCFMTIMLWTLIYYGKWPSPWHWNDKKDINIISERNTPASNCFHLEILHKCWGSWKQLLRHETLSWWMKQILPLRMWENSYGTWQKLQVVCCVKMSFINPSTWKWGGEGNRMLQN